MISELMVVVSIYAECFIRMTAAVDISCCWQMQMGHMETPAAHMSTLHADGCDFKSWRFELSTGASGGSVHGGASFKAEKALFAA